MAHVTPETDHPTVSPVPPVESAVPAERPASAPALPGLGRMEFRHLRACLQASRHFLALVHDPPQLAESLVHLTLEQLDARRGSLMVVDPASQTLRIQAARGLPSEVAQGLRLKLGEGVAGLVAAAGRPILVPTPPGNGSIDLRPRGQYLTRTFMSVPLTHDREVLGVLNVTDPPAGRLFQPSDLAVLLEIADVGGLALHQARLFTQAKQLAICDDLTGLYNRRYLRHFLDTILERAQAERFAVSLVIFDLDHFKAYNDAFGHPAGDLVLQEVARVMRSAFRSHDVICRYGGEEFAVVLWDHGPRRRLNSRHPIEALAFAERLRYTIQIRDFPHLTRRQTPQLTISGGLATFPWDGTTRQELITKADQALYRAKRDGRNRIYLSKPID